MTKQIPQVNLQAYSPMELLWLHSAIGDELQSRKLTRSANLPVGDIVETLFCRAFGWKMEPPSAASVDAVNLSDGTRYQIKGRRLMTEKSSRQLSSIRKLDQDGFDILAAVLLTKDYRVIRAAFIPIGVVKSQSRYNQHTNSALFILSDSIWDIKGVKDVTKHLQDFAASWEEGVV